MATVFLGVTLFAASYDSYQNLTASYEHTFTEFRFANLTVGGGDITGFAAIASATDGVEAVDLRTVVDLPLQIGEHKMLGRVVGLPAGRPPDVNRVDIVSGDPPAHDTLVLEEHLANHFDLTVGDSLAVLGAAGWQTMPVSGVAASPEYIWPARDRQEVLTSPDNFGVVFAVEEVAQSLGGLAAPNETVVYYRAGEEDAGLSADLLATARDLGATITFARDDQPSNAALSEDLKGFEELAVFFPALFLAAAGMATYVMISRLVHAQRPHIGGLLANGFTRRQVLLHYLGYGLVPGLAGAVPGVLAGVALARIITGFYTSMLAIPTTLIQFYPATLVFGVAFGVVTSLMAAAAPALRAARLAPATAMRGETPPGGGRPSVPERLLPPLRRLPLSWRMALRGIERNPRRTMFTVLGVVLSLMLVLVSWGMLDTVVHLMDRQFIEIQREDATVYFSDAVSPAEVASLERVGGIAAAEPVTQIPVVIRADGRYETSLAVLESSTRMHRFFAPDGNEVALPEDGLLIGAALEDLIGARTGGDIQLVVAGNPVAVRVAGFVDEPLGTMAYASRSYAETVSGGPLPATSALITYEPGIDGAGVRTALVDLPSVAAFEDANALYDTMQRFMLFFYLFVGVMLVFGGAMAFALIFSAMSVNIAERTREVATLLAVGTERRQITQTITAENMLVALVGVPLGLLTGYVAADRAMASFNSDLFTFDLFIRPTTFVIAALAILLVALLSQWPGLRAIGRLDIAEVVKERST
jgi:putative ABC transport system permease protein